MAAGAAAGGAEVIDLRSSSDREALTLAVKMDKAEAMVTSGGEDEDDEDGPIKTQKNEQQLRRTRLAIMVSYARQRPHYEAAWNWYKELEGLAAGYRGGDIVPVKNEPPQLYDDTECDDCRDLKEPIKHTAWLNGGGDMSGLPKIFHVFLQAAPHPRPPLAKGPCFSVCYLRDQEGPRTVLSTSRPAVLCGPCGTLRLAVLHYLVEHGTSQLLQHWEPLDELHEDHYYIEGTIGQWQQAKGLLSTSDV